jgi:hypothetical protein
MVNFMNLKISVCHKIELKKWDTNARNKNVISNITTTLILCEVVTKDPQIYVIIITS